MESNRDKAVKDASQEAEIRKKIAALQSLLPSGSTASLEPSSPPKKRRARENELAPNTPSPKKKRRTDEDGFFKLVPTHSSLPLALQKGKRPLSFPQPRPLKPSNSVTSSKFLSRMADIESQYTDDPEDLLPVQRSSGFTEHPSAPPPQPSSSKRDDRLALIEDLEPGPYDHKPSLSDPLFDGVEPHSGIRLSSRSLAHEDLQEYMTGRYYLSPSRLYSVIRLLSDQQSYEVPVAGDWITIAVVAERGPMKFTRAPIEATKDEDSDPRAKTNISKKPSGKKYVNFKLVDFGARSLKSVDSKAAIRGDAFLTLLLFEADSFDLVTSEADEKTGKRARAKKIYKGGSRGAFESMSKMREGDVIALLNPKILKPFQKSNERPHPSSNILAVTPESADSIEIIGRAKDLGMCNSIKRDGKPCLSWCDKRVSDVCDYHIQTAVEHRRASRPEFSIGTSGMSTTAQKRKRAHDYDPRKKWGLAPEDVSSSSTYVVSGHIVNSSQMHVSEKMGREAQAKAQRKLAGKSADRHLQSLLERDREGMQYVLKAREVGRELMEKEAKKGKAKKASEEGKQMEAQLLTPQETGDKKSGYSASMIKQLGFDPAFRPGQQQKNTAMLEKLKILGDCQSTRKTIELGPPPGPKIRSGVVVPLSSEALKGHEGNKMVDLDDI